MELQLSEGDNISVWEGLIKMMEYRGRTSAPVVEDSQLLENFNNYLHNLRTIIPLVLKLVQVKIP